MKPPLQPLQIRPCGMAPGTTRLNDTVRDRVLFWLGMAVITLGGAGVLVGIWIGFARCCL